jgi:hypothetical protein
MTKTRMSAMQNGSNGAAQKESTEATELKTRSPRLRAKNLNPAESMKGTHFASHSGARLWRSEFSRHAPRKQRRRFDLRTSRQRDSRPEYPKSETAITSVTSNRLRRESTTLPSTFNAKKPTSISASSRNRCADLADGCAARGGNLLRSEGYAHVPQI